MARAPAKPLFIASRLRKLGRLLVGGRGFGIVFSGPGHIGLMGVVADAVLAAGGEIVGVIPQGMSLTANWPTAT